MSILVKGGSTLTDISELFGFEKKSETSFSSPMSWMKSGNSRRKKARRFSGVFKEEIRDSGMNKVQVNDLSCVSSPRTTGTYIVGQRD